MKRAIEQETIKPDERTHHHRFDDPGELSKRFDAPERDEWQKPEQVIESFRLSDDATVAEIGSGTGYFAVRLAKYLNNGKVIGFDDEPKMTDFLKERAEKLGLTNVYARLTKAGDKVNLKEKVDLIFCVDTYHHIRDRVSYFSNYIPYLNAGGKLVIIDRAGSSPNTPQIKAGVSPETVKQEMQEAGLYLAEDIDILPYQYFMVFKIAEPEPE